MESFKNDQNIKINIQSEQDKPYNQECPCCLEVPNKGRIMMDCYHLMCIECFMKHNKKSNNCPICRTPYRENNKQSPLPDLLHDYNSRQAARLITSGLLGDDVEWEDNFDRFPSSNNILQIHPDYEPSSGWIVGAIIVVDILLMTIALAICNNK